MALNIKKGDNVLVIAGKDKTKFGKVLNANPSNNTVVVSGVNVITKHKKPKKAGEKGGIMKAEGKIDVSNVQVICPSCNKATRVSYKMEGDKKVRICKKCGAVLDVKVVAKKDTTKKSTASTKTGVKATPTKKAPAKTSAKKVTSKSITSATSKVAKPDVKKVTKTTATRKTSGK